MPLRKRIAFDCAQGYGELLGGSETVGPNWSVKNGDNQMRMRIQFTAALLLVLLLSKVGMGAKDEKDEPYNFFREYVGLNDDQIQAISHGKAFAKILNSGSWHDSTGIGCPAWGNHP
jgi:hypothetical protein